MFNVESTGELERLSAIASRLGKTAQVSLRINPNVDPKTHPYISTGLKKNKFGLDIDHSLAQPTHEPWNCLGSRLGIDCHIGSQLTSIAPFLEALDKILAFRDKPDSHGHRDPLPRPRRRSWHQYNEEEPPHPANSARP